MSLPQRIKWTGTAASVILLLSGCVPWPRERPGYIDLCQSEYQFNVTGPGGKSTVILETYLYDHAIPGLVMSEKQGHFNLANVQGPEARPDFYVQLIAYNKGRQRPSKPGRKGKPAIPILFDSRQAWLDTGDGSRQYARPEIFLGTDTFPYDFPGNTMKYARPSPYDINSDEVHRLVPRISNNDDYGSVYVVFKKWTREANAKWTVHLGELDVAGQKVAIPPLKLCYQPTKKWIGIEPLMRP